MHLFNEKAAPKTDSPTNYHSFIFSHRIFKTPFKYGYGYLVELECGHAIEFADTTKKEKELHKIFCPLCKQADPFIHPEETYYKGVERYRRVKIGDE